MMYEKLQSGCKVQQGVHRITVTGSDTVNSGIMHKMTVAVNIATLAHFHY